MKRTLLRWMCALLGKEPEPVIVILGDGPHATLMRELVPELRHVVIAAVAGESTGEAWLRLRRELAGRRVALAAVRTNEGALLWAALLACPGKVLAFNANLERHHVRLTTAISSGLFLAGVAVDRIELRPWWLCPWKKDRSRLPQSWSVREGRPWREGAPRVAVLSPYCPYPLSHGGAVRIYNLLRDAAREFDIALFAFEDGQTEDDFRVLLEFCCRLYIAAKPRYREPRWSTLLPPEAREFYTPGLRAALEAERRRYRLDVLQVEYTMLARYGGQILVEHDVTWDLFEQIHARHGTVSSWWDLVRWRGFERGALRRFPLVVAMSEKDAALLGRENVEVIPNGVDLERFQPETERAGARLLFIGSFRHFPNVAAYRFLIAEVWPLIAENLPGVQVTVVAGPDPQLYCAEPPPDDRIGLHGFVSDVRPLYAEANLVLIPTVVSAGTNLKALEAMAMRRAIVSTTCGVAGLGLEHGRSVWIADSAEDFAAGIQLLTSDPELRASLAEEANRLARARYGWPALAELQKDTWRKAASSVV